MTDDLTTRARRHAGTHPESRELIEELLDEVAVLRHDIEATHDYLDTAPAAGDDLRERIAAAIYGDDNGGDPWDKAAPSDKGAYRCNADAVLAVLPPQPVPVTGGSPVTPAPPPVPPWPGAVLSGLTDEDGVPTWLSQAGQVPVGVELRTCTDLGWVENRGVFTDTAWVEVRAPRAVPVPETERVPWWKAIHEGRMLTEGFVPTKAALFGGTPSGPLFLHADEANPVYPAPDGTVEVLAEDGDR